MRQPTGSVPPEYTIGDDEVPWVLGTQLSERSGPLARAPEGSHILLVEAHDFARRMPYHHHKLTLVLATKPYVSSASYVDRMSDYCEDCAYYKTKDTGEGACPFNALYWDFLDRNEDQLRSNHRMGLMYSHVDDKQDPGEIADIQDRVTELRDLAADGEL